MTTKGAPTSAALKAMRSCLIITIAFISMSAHAQMMSRNQPRRLPMPRSSCSTNEFGRTFAEQREYDAFLSKNPSGKNRFGRTFEEDKVFTSSIAIPTFLGFTFGEKDTSSKVTLSFDTDKFIYNDGFAPYLIINATQNEIFTTIHYVKDEHCYYTPDGGWFCDRTIIDSCPAPQITKLQADNLLRAYLSFNGESTAVPLPEKIFSPFDIYVIRKDKYLDASIIHVPKLSVRAKKSTIVLIQELQNTVPEIEKLFLNCRNKFNF